MSANTSERPKCPCGSRSVRPCLSCNYAGPFCEDCKSCPQCDYVLPGSWNCKTCGDPILFERKFLCDDCNTYHCSQCAYVCVCNEAASRPHYICEDTKHMCGDERCENRVCRNERLYGKFILCPEHPVRITPRLQREVIKHARGSKRAREEITKGIWE